MFDKPTVFMKILFYFQIISLSIHITANVIATIAVIRDKIVLKVGFSFNIIPKSAEKTRPPEVVSTL